MSRTATATAFALVSSFIGLAASAQAQLQDSSDLESKGAFSTLNAYRPAVPSVQNVAVPTLTISAGGMNNDDCMTPEPLQGQGIFFYDNSAATTGVEGQTETECLAFGSTGIGNDIWFAWTANETGTVTVSTCDSKGGDTKIAAYDGVGCPTGAPLACNDDTCGLLSEITFDVSLGTTYTLQVGNFPGSAGGQQGLSINIASDCYTADDGTAETAVGIGSIVSFVWLQGFEAIGGNDVITEVAAAFSADIMDGSPATVIVWDDPTDDFDPSDATLLYSGPILSDNEGSNFLNSYPVPNVAVTGVYFVGIAIDGPSGFDPAPQDEDTITGGRTWAFGSFPPGGTLDISDPSSLSNSLTLFEVESANRPGAWLLRAVGENCTMPDDSIGEAFCSPANVNSSGAPGTLVATGSDVAADNDLTITASDLPSMQFGYLVNSMNMQMMPINVSDGMLCIGGGIGRHVAQIGNSGASGEIATVVDLSSLPRPTGPEPVMAGQTWFWQFWYRDGMGSNFTDSLEILFQ